MKNNFNGYGRSYSVYALCLSIYFLISPLEDILTSSLGTLSKYIAGILLIFWFYDHVRSGNRIKFNKFVVLPIYLVLLSWTSILWSYDIQTTFNRNISYTLLPALYILVINRKISQREIKLMDYSILLGGVVTCIIALFNYFYVGVASSRLTLTEDSDPNGFVGRLLISLYVAFKYLQVKHTSRLMYILLYFAFGIMVFSIFLSGSRGGFLTFLIIGLIWISIIHKDNILRKMIFMFSILLLILILSSFLPVDIFERITKIDSYTRDFASDYSRSYLWKSFFLKILPDSPILGFGSGTTGLLTLSYNGRFQVLHNTYFSLWLEYGLFGLPIFLYLIYSFFICLKTSGLIAELGLFLGTLCIIFFLDAYPKKYLWNTLMYIGLILNFPNLYVKNSNPTRGNMEIERLNGEKK